MFNSVNRAIGSCHILFAATLAFAATSTGGVASAQTVTFEQVMADPDNLALNLEYAKQEIVSGRIQQAASALERILLVQPNFDAARLYYGITLYRLDDLTGAVRELTLLEGRDLTPIQERDRLRYLKLATAASDPFRMTAQITLGARVDENPGRLADTIIDAATGGATAVDTDTDYAGVGIGRFRIEADIGDSGTGNFLFFETSAYINEYLDTDSADLVLSQNRFGAVLYGANFSITPYALYDATWVRHDHVRSRYGGGVDGVVSLSSQVELALKGQSLYEDFSTTSFSSVGSLRDGWRNQVEVGLKYRPLDTQIFRLGARLARKNADFDGYSYDERKFSASSLSLLGDGIYLALSGNIKFTEYDEPDNLLSATVARDDEKWQARAALGAPLETIFAKLDVELPESIADIVAQVGVTYTEQDSSIQSLNYDNWSGDLLFTKKYQF